MNILMTERNWLNNERDLPKQRERHHAIKSPYKTGLELACKVAILYSPEGMINYHHFVYGQWR